MEALAGWRQQQFDQILILPDRSLTTSIQLLHTSQSVQKGCKWCPGLSAAALCSVLHTAHVRVFTSSGTLYAMFSRPIPKMVRRKYYKLAISVGQICLFLSMYTWFYISAQVFSNNF
jgi:hypothetical protein